MRPRTESRLSAEFPPGSIALCSEIFRGRLPREETRFAPLVVPLRRTTLRRPRGTHHWPERIAIAVDRMRRADAERERRSAIRRMGAAQKIFEAVNAATGLPLRTRALITITVAQAALDSRIQFQVNR